MADLTNPTSLPNGYKNGQQAPLDGKTYFENEADLLDIANNRPLEWYKEMEVVERENGKKYLWRESEEGLIPGAFTYPNNVTSFGFDYSGKKFNWVEVFQNTTVEDPEHTELLSVGYGTEIYKGENVDGKSEIKSIAPVGSGINLFKEDAEQETIEVKTIESIGVGIDIVEENNTEDTLEIKSILSKGNNVSAVDILTQSVAGDTIEVSKVDSNTLLISKDLDGTLRIEAEEVDLGGVRNFYVNNQYTGDDELGTIAKPYKTIDLAITDYIGSGDIYTPEFLGSKIIVQTSTTNYSLTKPLNVKKLNFEVESGANVYYSGSQEYMCDLRELLNHVDYDSSEDLLVRFYGYGSITALDKGLLYSRGSDGYSTTNYSQIEIYDELNFRHYYKTSEIENIPKTVGDTDYYSTYSVPTKFSTNNADIQPSIVCDGDNLESVNLAVIGSMNLEITNQIGVLIKNKGYFFKNINTNGSVYIKVASSFSPKVTINVNGSVNELIPNPDFHLIKIEDGALYLKEFNASIGSTTDITTVMESCIKLEEPTVSTVSYLSLFSGVIDNCSESVNFIDNHSDPSNHRSTIRNLIGSSTGASEYMYKNSNASEEISLTMDNCSFDKPIGSNIDLTRGNVISVSNTINSQLIQSLRSFPDRITAASSLPVGGIFINTNSNDVDTANHFIDTVI